MKNKKGLTAILACLTLFILSQPCPAEKNSYEDPENETGFYYTIKKGDTLWNLSQRFYNSKWIWPGLWEMNRQIDNPHWIYPGQTIRVYLKDAVLPEKQQNVQPKVGLTQPPHIQKTIQPVFHYAGMNGLGFIKKQEVMPMGRILKAVRNQQMIAMNDLFYIEPMGKEDLVPGRLYRVYTATPVNQAIDGQKFQGVQHTIICIAEIIEHNGNYVTAKIKESFQDAKTGDKLMSFQQPSSKIPISRTVDKLESRIICSENHDMILADRSIAFINRGEDQGIKPGQIYTVFQEKENLAGLGKKIIQIAPREKGRLIILHTEKIAATVMILAAKCEISPGALVQ